MARVYLETSFVSACVTDRNDPGSIYRRETSLEWWATQRRKHDLFLSAEVITELSHPRYPHRAAALAHLGGVRRVLVTPNAIGLAEVLVREKVMPSPVAANAIHLAVATVHDADYLLTWNVRHLANPNKLRHLRTICTRLGLLPPLIVTPELLWEEET